MPAPSIESLTPATDFAGNPYAAYRLLREQGPVHRVTIADYGEVWAVVGYEEARAALADPRLSSDPSHGAPGGDGVGVFLQAMHQMDPPEHTRLRKLVATDFTARRVRALRPRIQAITDDLLDKALPLGRTDLIASLALPLATTVICELLGIPDADRETFHGWAAECACPADAEARAAAAGATAEYLTGLVAAKRREGSGDDVLSALACTTADEGDRLSAEELLSMAFLLFFAGHETTLHLIGNGVLALLRHPDQLDALRADWDLLDGAVEELMRYDGPVMHAPLRYTTEPVDVAGTTVPAGQPVVVVLAAASRDPRRFPEPDRFDIRRDARGHLGLSHGVHHCLGGPLARAETSIALRSVFERCPRIALDTDPAGLVWHSRPSWLRGLRHLPVRYA
ncbi:cytochrome P450 [Streptomyces longispororuber]|uniref:Cytochrome P450 n=1 Tax=Streptomyces longispororuber TaxID=68230 RepID=A0A918ZYV4_9ACTN|nr:cytochrome P450 [Streptomyces longispororuber]GHE79067.1 cytochrome P450 [Streptomyces longispororuber]